MKKFFKNTFLSIFMILTILSVSACSKEGSDVQKKPVEQTGVIKIATKPMTEQFILGEMLAMIIEQETGLGVEITKGIGGGTSNIHPALVKGEFDLYPEYTATGWLMVLKKDNIPSDDVIFDELNKEYKEQFNLKWVGEYGFNNTFALAVRKEIADMYNLNTYSDLAKVSDKVTFGGNYDFIEREDGYNSLCEAYGFKFKNTVDIDIGLKYQALENKEIDVTNAFTTDAQLSAADVKILEDDLHHFTNYYAGTIVRMDTLEKYPNLENALMKMDNILSDSEMADLNYKVEVEKMDEKDVAKEFLELKGILK